MNVSSLFLIRVIRVNLWLILSQLRQWVDTSDLTYEEMELK